MLIIFDMPFWAYAQYRPDIVVTYAGFHTHQFHVARHLHGVGSGAAIPFAEMGAARASQLSGKFMSVVMDRFRWRILPQRELIKRDREPV